MTYGLPEASDEQLDRIEQVLRSLEFERNERIQAEGTHAAPPAPPTAPAATTSPAGCPCGAGGPRDALAAPGRRPQARPHLSIAVVRTAEGWHVLRGAEAFPVEAELPSTAALVTGGLGAVRAAASARPGACRSTACRCCRRSRRPAGWSRRR